MNYRLIIDDDIYYDGYFIIVSYNQQYNDYHISFNHQSKYRVVELFFSSFQKVFQKNNDDLFTSVIKIIINNIIFREYKTKVTSNNPNGYIKEKILYNHLFCLETKIISNEIISNNKFSIEYKRLFMVIYQSDIELFTNNYETITSIINERYYNEYIIVEAIIDTNKYILYQFKFNSLQVIDTLLLNGVIKTSKLYYDKICKECMNKLSIKNYNIYKIFNYPIFTKEYKLYQS
jgi:hypothetical protein